LLLLLALSLLELILEVKVATSLVVLLLPELLVHEAAFVQAEEIPGSSLVLS